jgi:hypothetical protein
MVRCKEPKHEVPATITIIHGQQATVHFAFEQPIGGFDLFETFDSKIGGIFEWARI